MRRPPRLPAGLRSALVLPLALALGCAPGRRGPAPESQRAASALFHRAWTQRRGGDEAGARATLGELERRYPASRAAHRARALGSQPARPGLAATLFELAAKAGADRAGAAAAPQPAPQPAPARPSGPTGPGASPATSAR